MGSVLARAGNHHQRPLGLLSAGLKCTVLFGDALGLATLKQMVSRQLLMRCFCDMLGVRVVVRLLVGNTDTNTIRRLAMDDVALGLLSRCEHTAA